MVLEPARGGAGRAAGVSPVEELERQLAAARGEIASLRRDFSHWWAWADQQAAPVIRYLRCSDENLGAQQARPERLRRLDNHLETLLFHQGTLTDELAAQKTRMEQAQEMLMGSLGTLAVLQTDQQERLDALALVVNNRLEALEEEAGELRHLLSREAPETPTAADFDDLPSRSADDRP